jgi:hypothetical protein
LNPVPSSGESAANRTSSIKAPKILRAFNSAIGDTRTLIPAVEVGPGALGHGGRDWVRLGAVELGLDCLRRYLQGLPVTERTDFERV